MKFSLVTTCFNEISSLPAWRRDMEAQTRFPDEIVVVDSVSTDGTLEALWSWAEDNPRVRVIVEKSTVAAGRNTAIRNVTHEHILSTDLGVRLDRRWVEELVRPFEADPEIDVVLGSYGVDMSTIKSSAARAEFYISGDGCPYERDEAGNWQLRKGQVPSNRSVAYTKRVWHELGGLPEDLSRAADDAVFGQQIMNAQYRLGYAPEALAYWCRPTRLRDFWKEAAVYAVGGGEAAIRKPIAFRLYQKGYLPRCMIPLVTALRMTQTHLPLRSVCQALAKRDLIGLLYMPILMFGNGWVRGEHYPRGYEHGSKHCLECRARLGAK